MITSSTLENDNIQAFKNDNIVVKCRLVGVISTILYFLQSWMSCYHPGVNVISFSAGDVIIFEIEDVIIFLV